MNDRTEPNVDVGDLVLSLDRLVVACADRYGARLDLAEPANVPTTENTRQLDITWRYR